LTSWEHGAIDQPMAGLSVEPGLQMNPVKYILKRLFFIIGLILTSPLIILTWLEALFLGKKAEWIYNSCKEILSLCPTTLGEYMRLAYYWAVCTHVSPNACFCFGSMVAHRDTIIHSGVVVGVYSILGFCEVGENVLFGARVSLISGKYQHGRPEERALNGFGTEFYQKLTIGSNSWIGQEAILMANIGENCTVAAGSVVYKTVPDGATVMGNPARKVSLDIAAEKSERSSV